MRPFRPAWFAALLLLALPALAHGQAAEIRRSLDSVFVVLGRSTTPVELGTAKSMCGAVPGRGKALCEAFVALRGAELAPTPDNAVRADQAFRAVHFYEEKWPYLWYGLGLTRIVMARAAVIAREGPLQPPGVTNEAAASHAFVRALELEPAFSLAAEALALAPIPREGASQMGKRVAMLRTVRGTSMTLSPTAWAVMGVVERVAGSPDTAAAVLRHALRVGADSGFAGWELARALYLAGRADEGWRAMIDGAAHGRSALGRARFDRTVRLVGSPDELATWDSLGTARLAPWFAAFWVQRDVRDGRSVGESLTEHFRRVEDAWRRYRIDIPRTGRHRDAVPSGYSNAGTGDARRDGFSDGNLMGGLDATAPTDYYVDSYRIDAPFRTFQLPDDQLDDRGVILIRHGDPAKSAITVGTSGPDLELWRYDLPTGPRFFAFREVQFDGTTGAGVLTPQIATAANRQQLCAVDERLCLVTRGREALQAANMREEGLEAIRIGTTTDAHLRTFTSKIDPIVQIYGLDRAAGGAPRLVGAFAVPADRLTHTSPPEAGGRTVYSLRLQLMAARSGGERIEVDTVRHFATPRPLGKGEFITGVLELPVAAGSYSATLVITQADGRGAVASLGRTTAPGTRGLTVSDVVLGREGSGTRWNSGATVVSLNPLNAYTPADNAELYYQVGGLIVGTPYETRLEFFRAGEEDRPAKLALTFRDDASSVRTEVARTIALRELAAGRYVLRVTVSGGAQRATSSAWLVVVKR